jgi:hypothetical protein
MPQHRQPGKAFRLSRGSRLARGVGGGGDTPNPASGQAPRRRSSDTTLVPNPPETRTLVVYGGCVVFWVCFLKGRLCRWFVALLIIQFSKPSGVIACGFSAPPPFPPLVGIRIMDAAFSFASSCRDELVCLIAGVETWLVVSWQPVLLFEGCVQAAPMPI